MNLPDYAPHFKLQIGDDAPDFISVIQNGHPIQLKAINSTWIILFFYPQDNTPTCIKEACNLRDNYDDLKNAGAAIFGISPDSKTKHQKFISKFDLPYDLIVDQDHQIALSYHVWGSKKFMGIVYDGIHRTTYILNQNHKIHQIIYPVDSAIHHQQILESIKS